ncbi:MAG: YafY family transcriptional regulator [Henriciella sp.]|nr:YafY family transcriptional regulator [Henriciella sp.]MBO6695349.1 YafY family transcriptional regulator [Henriciella sp.]
MAKSDRLLQMMQCLRTFAPPVKAQALSDELGVSLRTIYRDIDMLRRSGALIDGEAGYGYTLQEDPALPPMMFSRDEMESLVLGLREVVQVADPVLAKAAENALSKLKASLPERMRSEFEHAVLYAKRFHCRPEISIDIAAFRQATRNEQVVEINYVDAEDMPTVRAIQPLAIVFFDRSLVALAWCELRKDYRSFRIDRIRHMIVTNRSFRPRRVAMLREYLDRLERSDPEP